MSENEETARRSRRLQMIGSLIAAVLIVAATIAIVTAQIGPGLDRDEVRELEEQLEERLEERQELREERREELRERREDR